MSKRLRVDPDDLNDFEPSDSDEEYDEREKTLLNKVRNRKKQYSDSEEEVFGVGSNNADSDEDSNQSDIALSDVEGQDDDDELPNVRAWGKDRKKFYGADYVDPDYGGYEGKDAQAAEIEEEEARNLQSQLVQQLDDGDFSLDVIFKKPVEDKGKVQEEIIKTDISQLSKKQKLQLLQKESPEFFGLIEDFEVKMTLAQDYLHPILQKYRKGQLRNCEAMDFVETHYQLILNYSANIYMYLLLKLNKEINNHPIIKRLYQYRQLLSQIEPVFEEVVKPQIEILLEQNTEENVANKKQKKKLKLLTTIIKKNEDKKAMKRVAFTDDTSKPMKKQKLNKDKEKDQTEESESEDEGLEENNKKPVESNQEGPEKRAITYQMSKNKGLTPHRKKEQRNPRVKHKLKYRKAVIRRKGAIREPRKELSRYSGEISGIKATVSKSIKIKS